MSDKKRDLKKRDKLLRLMPFTLGEFVEKINRTENDVKNGRVRSVQQFKRGNKVMGAGT